MNVLNWILNNYIELFGALTGIIYVFLEIRQSLWLWPLGIITSALYILVFFSSKFYADSALQVYYLTISVYGWYWWRRAGRREEAESGELRAERRKEEAESGERRAERRKEEEESVERRAERGEEKRHKSRDDGEAGELAVTRLQLRTGLVLAGVFVALFAILWYILDNFTDTTVPGWDSFLTSLSIVATWMLARKILEHWILWIIVDVVSVFVYASKGLYPTGILFIVYSIMACVGLFKWRKHLILNP